MIKIKVNEIKTLEARLAEINALPLDEIKFINDKGNGIYIPKKRKEEFKFTGLNNSDFIMTGFYKTGWDKE